MKKAFYLTTCNTCQRILKEVDAESNFELQEIKSEPVTKAQLEELHQLAGSYEALFNRRAQKYRKLGLHEHPLTEADYKHHILEEYTFLKRPVFVLDNQIFIGNSKKTIDALKNALNK